MEEQHRGNRSSIFTVRNAENAMVTFTIFALFCLLSLFLHALLINSLSFLHALYNVAGNISKIMSAATMLTIFEEGADIMFQRIRDTLKKEREIKAQAIAEGRAEGRAEGITEGRAEGITEGRAEGRAEVYQAVMAWNTRRLAAEARGERFTEPPPIPPQDPSS